MYTLLFSYPGNELEKERKQLIVENVSSLPLSLLLRLQYPFQFVVDDSKWESHTLDTSVSKIRHGEDN